MIEDQRNYFASCFFNLLFFCGGGQIFLSFEHKFLLSFDFYKPLWRNGFIPFCLLCFFDGFRRPYLYAPGSVILELFKYRVFMHQFLVWSRFFKFLLLNTLLYIIILILVMIFFIVNFCFIKIIRYHIFYILSDSMCLVFAFVCDMRFI